MTPNVGYNRTKSTNMKLQTAVKLNTSLPKKRVGASCWKKCFDKTISVSIVAHSREYLVIEVIFNLGSTSVASPLHPLNNSGCLCCCNKVVQSPPQITPNISMKPAQYQLRRWLPAKPSSPKLDKMCFEN